MDQENLLPVNSLLKPEAASTVSLTFKLYQHTWLQSTSLYVL